MVIYGLDKCKWKGCVSLSCVLRHGKYHSGPTGADLSLLGGGPD